MMSEAEYLRWARAMDLKRAYVLAHCRDKDYVEPDLAQFYGQQ